MAVYGLVLTGGGARAAYQVGALKGLAQILGDRRPPFQVMTGSSAGAINATSLATRADSFATGVEELEEIWLSLSPDQVYRTDFPSLFTIGFRWLKTLFGGGNVPGRAINHLLDTAPLRELLLRRLDLGKLAEHLDAGALRALALSATNYVTGTAITFFEGASDIEPWVRSTRLGRRQTLTVDHVMASSAIPLFFPPIRLETAFFGDGCIRLTAPLSPAIHLGSDKLVAVSVRYLRTGAETTVINEVSKDADLTLAEVSGVLLNAIFLDSIESDVERVERINRTLELIPAVRLREVPHGLRKIPVLVLRPSQDLGALAAQQQHRFPRLLRYLLAGLGVGRKRGSDLVSYLAFERDYVQKLIQLGYRDSLERTEEIRAFFD